MDTTAETTVRRDTDVEDLGLGFGLGLGVLEQFCFFLKGKGCVCQVVCFFSLFFSLKPFSLTVVGSTILLGLSHSLLRTSELGGSDDLHRLRELG